MIGPAHYSIYFVINHEPRATCYEIRATILELRATSCFLWATRYEKRDTRLGIQDTRYEQRDTRYNLRLRRLMIERYNSWTVVWLYRAESYRTLTEFNWLSAGAGGISKLKLRGRHLQEKVTASTQLQCSHRLVAETIFVFSRDGVSLKFNPNPCGWGRIWLPKL